MLLFRTIVSVQIVSEALVSRKLVRHWFEKIFKENYLQPIDVCGKLQVSSKYRERTKNGQRK